MADDLPKNGELGAEQDARLVATAYHEAGHAVMAVMLGRLVHKVTIEPGRSAFGQKRLGQCEMGKGRSKAAKDLLAEEVLILYAGMIAESHLTGEYCEQGAGQDLALINRLLGPQVKTQKQFERLRKRLFDKAEYLLADKEHAEAIKLVAAQLIQRKTISGRSVRHFFNHATRKR